MTGQDFDNIFRRKINQAYSDYYNTTKRNSLYAEALLSAIESKYKSLDEQREYDYLRSVISTNQTFDLTNSAIDIADITSYNHLLSCRPITKDLDFSAEIKKFDNTIQPTEITFYKKTALRHKEMLLVTDPNALTRTETLCYVKLVSTYRYKLYLNEDLTEEANVLYTNPTIERYVSYWAKPYISDRKISLFGKPTIYRPKYEVADNSLKLYPYSLKVILDYLKESPVAIICTDTTTNLTDSYPDKFLYYVAEKAAEIYFREVRDPNYGVQRNEIMTDLNGQ